MAVLTVNQPPHGVEIHRGRPIFLFGHPVPENVNNLSSWYSVQDGGTWVGWTTNSGNNHKQLLTAEGAQDDIIALLVTMRMSE
jgi:hypothetical protein